MKKVLLILSIVFALAACAQIIESMNWFLNLSVSQSGGTPATEFIFTVNTNDSVSSWYVNGEKVQPTFNNARVAISDSFKQTFPVGDYTISALSTNGETDKLNIKVRNIVFNVVAVPGETTTDIFYDYPYVAYDDNLYNINTVTNYAAVRIEHTNTDIVINLLIEADYIDIYYFQNNNLMINKNIDPSNMNGEEFFTLLTLLYPEKYEPPYLFTKYRLTGKERDDTFPIFVYPDRVQVNSVTIMNQNADKVFTDDTRYLCFDIEYDYWDQWLFSSNNMYNFIGIDMNDMSYSEFVIVADILRRYPETTIWDLQAEYNP